MGQCPHGSNNNWCDLYNGECFGEEGCSWLQDFLKSGKKAVIGSDGEKYAPLDTMYINICGGPGVGKSTMAAEVFSAVNKGLAAKGKSCELVTEFAKDLIWSDATDTLRNYEFIAVVKQLFKLVRLNGKVDYVITDAPNLINLAYIRDEKYCDTLSAFLVDMEQTMRGRNYFLDWVPGRYQEMGRREDEEWGKDIHDKMKAIYENLLDKHKIEHLTSGDFDFIKKQIVSDIELDLES
jgi:hypothetical protein